MRVILYLGKGGVGKTTVAASTALRSAELGYKTLVASTDIAHSLADSLDVPLSAEPTQVTSRLWAQEINVVADIHNHWGTLQSYISGIIRNSGAINNVVADELSSFPGIEEIVSLLHINKQARECNFDRVVIDAAPTGETIRLLTMPDTFRWYTGHLMRFRGGFAKVLQPFARRLLQSPAHLMENLDRLDKATAELRSTLSDPEISSYRLVLQPEKMVIREAERAVSYLGLFNYPVDLIVVNRVLSEADEEGEFYRRRRFLQAGNLEMIENNFSPLPIWRAPYYPDEVVGLAALSRLAEDCFGDEDPGQIFYRGTLQEIKDMENGCYQLRLPLPFISRENVNLRKRGDELFITIGNFKREMILPNVLAKRKAAGGCIRDSILEIDFVPPDKAGTA